MKMRLIVSMIVGLLFSVNAVQAASEHGATGKINSIDLPNRTINISHDPIPSMGMSAMSMDFRVSDPAMLQDLRKGQKIDFVVTTDRRGRFVIVDLE